MKNVAYLLALGSILAGCEPDAPTADAPTADAPTADAPTVDVPALDAPSIDDEDADTPTDAGAGDAGLDAPPTFACGSSLCAQEVVVTGTRLIRAMHVDESGILLVRQSDDRASGDTLEHLALDGTGATTLWTAMPLWGLDAPTSDGTDAYFADPQSASIRAVALDGSDLGVARLVEDTPGLFLYRMELRGSEVFGYGTMGGTEAIVRIDRTTHTIQTLAAGTFTYRFLLDDGDVFFATAPVGVFAVPQTGGARRPLDDAPAILQHLDGPYVYYDSYAGDPSGGYHVRRVLRDGSAPAELVYTGPFREIYDAAYVDGDVLHLVVELPDTGSELRRIDLRTGAVMAREDLPFRPAYVDRWAGYLYGYLGVSVFRVRL